MASAIDPTTGLTCFVCTAFIAGTYVNLTKHFKDARHFRSTASTTRENLICGQDGCQEKFETFANFRWHIINCDKAKLPLRPRLRPPQRRVSFQPLPPLCSPPPTSDHIENNVTTEDRLPENFDVTKQFAILMLKCRAFHNVTHETLNFLSTQLTIIFQEISRLVPLESQINTAVTSLATLNTQPKRMSYFSMHLGLHPPVSISVGHSRQTNTGGVPRPIPLTFQYFPVQKTLSALFSNSKFREIYFSESMSTDGLIRNHRDSLHFKQHPLFSIDQNALRLAIFFDEAEMVNPLGSKTKKHDQGMFLFQIHNMPSSFNSHLSSIFPIATCNGSYLRQYGFDFVLQTFKNELDILESNSGMLLNVDSMPGYRLRGTVICLCADTKGAHELCGFMSPSADSFCRLCLIKRSEIPLLSQVDKSRLRNRENYAAGVKKSIDLKACDSATGIARDCIMNKSRYYHVADAEKQVMDAMHDFLEGNVSFVVKLVLRYLYFKDAVKAETLNRRIKTFLYSESDSCNKPSPRFTDEGLKKEGNYNTKQRASQNWCLVRMLPLLIGDLVSVGDECFALLLKLLEIMDIVFCPEATQAHPAILKHLIIEIFEMQTALFPGLIPPNKWHHMTHYVDIIRMFGPPIRYWCMRFEAFHNIAKRRALVNFNFINLSKSVAMHLAAVFASNLLDETVFENNKISLGPTDQLTDEERIFLPFDPNSPEFVKTKWVSVSGYEYKKKTVIVLQKSHETHSSLPLFGEIETIIIQNETCVSFIVTLVDTIAFESHYHAYRVARKKPAERVVYKLNDLPVCQPLNFLKNFTSDDVLYLCPRHYI